MNIPLVDLKLQHKIIKKEINEAIQTVIDEAAFYQGRHVREFEKNFAKMMNTKHCVAVANCTDALFITMKCLKIGHGHEVITAANTFIATAEAITATGAKVVFCDIDPKTFNIDISKICGLITPRTRAIIPVHLCGRPVDMGKFKKAIRNFNLRIIEDCAQAAGATQGRKRVGTMGNAGCFSFYPAKNIGAFGDAGCVITNDNQLAETIRMMADHGRKEKYKHIFEGMSSRMDGIHAAILNVKLKYLDGWNKKRRKNAKLYEKYLEKTDGVLLPEISNSHVVHVYQIRVEANKRKEIRTRMKKVGIETGIHYPLALPNQPAYNYLGYNKADFPRASMVQEEIISLPMYPELTEWQIKYISACLIEAMK